MTSRRALDAEVLRPRPTLTAVTLTLRVQQVVGLVRAGLGNKQITARLIVSTHTVKSHVSSALEKTGLKTRVLLAISTA